VFDVAGAAAHANGANGTNGGAHRRDDDGPAATAVGDIRETLPGMSASSTSSSTSTSTGGGGGAAQSSYFNEKPLATPATRKAARDLGIDLKRVPPTGPQGRVTKKDVESFGHGGGGSGGVSLGMPLAASIPTSLSTPPQPVFHAPVVVPASGREPVRITPPGGGAGQQHGALEERVPFAGMRRRIAQRMATSTQTAAHFTFVEECDVTALKALRARMKPPAEAQGVKLTFLPFIVKAVVAGLKKHPTLNSALDESTNELVFRKYFHIGVAASTEAGLMVPVVKDADRKSLLEIAREIDRLADDARAGKAKVEDLGGSTFTVTSLGAQGGLFATPIINFPEVGILGVHQMKQKPVVKDGQIVIGDVMLLSLSFDHRIVDGHVGAAFAYEVIGYLENPDRLFLEL
jgi:pyruvate dehydrogenase E2 component (dihydrolipoamide acetyltransferase)